MLSKEQFCIAILQEWCLKIGKNRGAWSEITIQDLNQGGAAWYVYKAALSIKLIEDIETPFNLAPMFKYMKDPLNSNTDMVLTFDEIYTSLPDRVIN